MPELSAEDNDAVLNVFARYGDAWGRRDARGCAAMYSADGDLIAADGEVCAGPDAVEAYYDCHEWQLVRARSAWTSRSHSSGRANTMDVCASSRRRRVALRRCSLYGTTRYGRVVRRLRVATQQPVPEFAAGVSPERFRREVLVSARLQHPHISRYSPQASPMVCCSTPCHSWRVRRSAITSVDMGGC